MDGQGQAPAVLRPGKGPCARFTGGWVGTEAGPHWYHMQLEETGAFYLTLLDTAKIYSVVR